MKEERKRNELYERSSEPLVIEQDVVEIVPTTGLKVAADCITTGRFKRPTLKLFECY